MGVSFAASHFTESQNMSGPEHSMFRLTRSAVLPLKSDFDPYGGCLDALCAWDHFGGSTLQQAYRIFLTNPLSYQEDFMFMGRRAFEYYFPVVDHYLREVSGERSEAAAILGYGIALQFDGKAAALAATVVSEIEALSIFVQADPARCALEPQECRRFAKAWQKVDEKIAFYHSNRQS